MKSCIALLFLAVAMGLSLRAQTRSALETDPKGWLDLLADKSLKSWTRLSIPPSAPLAQATPWKFSDAATLVCDGDKAGHEWLRFDREIGNCILHAEWAFTKVAGEPRYNSGVFIRSSADAAIWHQAQTGSASGGYLFGETLVNGAKVRVNLRDQVKEQRVRPAGEWNTFEIRAEGRKISLWVNGGVTCELTECEVSRGYIGLEAEGYRIEFRNVKLKELP